MSDNSKINQEVEKFNRGNLRKTSTSEKNYKPTQAGRCSFREKNKRAYNKSTSHPPQIKVSPFPQLLVLYSSAPPCLLSEWWTTANIALLINCRYTPNHMRELCLVLPNANMFRGNTWPQLYLLIKKSILVSLYDNGADGASCFSALWGLEKLKRLIANTTWHAAAGRREFKCPVLFCACPLCSC